MQTYARYEEVKKGGCWSTYLWGFRVMNHHSPTLQVWSPHTHERVLEVGEAPKVKRAKMIVRSLQTT